MKSLCLARVYDTLISDPNLSDNKLFFNYDGTVNVDELCEALKPYGITRSELLQAIDDYTIDVLTNENGNILAATNRVAVNNLFIEWLSLQVDDNAVISTENNWDASAAPAGIFEYYDPTNKVWIGTDPSVAIPSGLDIQFATPIDSISGLSCVYGRMDFGFTQDVIDTVMKTKNGIITIDTDGTFVDNLLSLPYIKDNNYFIQDVARHGNDVYYFISGSSHLYKVKANGTLDELSHESVAAFSLPDINIIIKGVLSNINGTLYGIAIDDTSRFSMFKYNIISESLDVLPNTLSPVLMAASTLTAEFISDDSIIMFDPDTDSISKYGLDDAVAEWSIPTPKVAGEDSFNRISGISYDPVHNYLYMVTSKTLVRYSID